MPIQYFSEMQIIMLALILIRVSTFLMVFPLVEGGNIPNSAKILLSLIISIILFGVVSKVPISDALITENLVLMIIREILIGVTIGFIAKLLFAIISSAADIITMSIGLSSDQMFNPALGRRSSSIERYHLLIGALIFLVLNGHHYFLEGLFMSFDLVPLTSLSLNLEVYQNLGFVGQALLEMGVKIAAPVLGTIFLSNMALGIIGRTVPQINVLITSWPINIMLGFIVLIVTLPLLIVGLEETLHWNVEYLIGFLKTF